MVGVQFHSHYTVSAARGGMIWCDDLSVGSMDCVHHHPTVKKREKGMVVLKKFTGPSDHQPCRKPWKADSGVHHRLRALQTWCQVFPPWPPQTFRKAKTVQVETVVWMWFSSKHRIQISSHLSSRRTWTKTVGTSIAHCSWAHLTGKHICVEHQVNF